MGCVFCVRVVLCLHVLMSDFKLCVIKVGCVSNVCECKIVWLSPCVSVSEVVFIYMKREKNSLYLQKKTQRSRSHSSLMLRLKRQWCAILERIAGSLVICVSIFSAISVEKKKKKTDKKEEGK